MSAPGILAFAVGCTLIATAASAEVLDFETDRAGEPPAGCVEVKGDVFRVSLDGVHLFEVRDTTFAEPGRIGLWTKADSVTAFDRLEIEAQVLQEEP
jgi:hypothetical protein